MGSVRMISLNNIKLGKICHIIDIKSDFSMSRRFLDMGIIPEAIIEKVLVSPFKGISAYYIMGTTIAIRDKDAEGIIVSYG